MDQFVECNIYLLLPLLVLLLSIPVPTALPSLVKEAWHFGKWGDSMLVLPTARFPCCVGQIPILAWNSHGSQSHVSSLPMFVGDIPIDAHEIPCSVHGIISNP